MNGYILTILAASLVAAVTELLAPQGEGGRLAASIRMVAGLFLLVALISPLKEGILWLRSAADGELSEELIHRIPPVSAEDYEAVWGESLAEIGRAECEAWISSVLESVFGIPPSGQVTQVVCVGDGGSLVISEVRIVLSGEYLLKDPLAIETYIGEHLGCPCYVTVEL